MFLDSFLCKFCAPPDDLLDLAFDLIYNRKCKYFTTDRLAGFGLLCNYCGRCQKAHCCWRFNGFEIIFEHGVWGCQENLVGAFEECKFYDSLSCSRAFQKCSRTVLSIFLFWCFMVFASDSLQNRADWWLVEKTSNPLTQTILSNNLFSSRLLCPDRSGNLLAFSPDQLEFMDAFNLIAFIIDFYFCCRTWFTAVSIALHPRRDLFSIRQNTKK